MNVVMKTDITCDTVKFTVPDSVSVEASLKPFMLDGVKVMLESVGLELVEYPKYATTMRVKDTDRQETHITLIGGQTGR